MPELPDWTKGAVLLGKYGDDYLAIATDAAGQMYVLTVGIDGTSTTRVLRTDDAGQLIIVPRGSSGNYLDVDSDGFLTAVIKGDYEGTLKTVKADSEGRLSAFIIDSVDAWGNMLSIGNAELAVRLGSGVVFDQRGRVRLFEDFSEGGPRWVASLSGTGAATEIVPDTFISGGYCYKLTGGSTSDKYAMISSTFGASTLSLMGISLGFATGGNLDYLSAKVTVWSGTYEYRFGMVYDHTNSDFESWDEGGTLDKIADAVANDDNIYQWNQMKIVADVEARSYIRAMFNDSEYDISDYNLYRAEWFGWPKVLIEICAYSRSGYNDVVYVDNVVFTLAEPE